MPFFSMQIFLEVALIQALLMERLWISWISPPRVQLPLVPPCHHDLGVTYWALNASFSHPQLCALHG